MTQDEIRKLLGGYATNTLSAQERQLLFEAAIEDQELFNALENEDALRELLDDPVLRDQVRGVLRGPLAHKPRPGFGLRRWLLGVAIPAVVAVILIVMMNRATAPRLTESVPETVARNIPQQAPPAPPKPEALPAQAKKQSAVRRPPARVIPAPAPIPPGPIQLDSARAAFPAARPTFLVAPSSAMPEAVRQQFAAGFAATAPLYQGPLVRYSIVRSGPAGDAVRIDVSTGIAGYLALYRVDASGNSTRVYPERDVAAHVLPGLPIQIPNAPIKLAPAGERLRLVVLPVAQAAVVGQLSTGQLATPGLGGAINGTIMTGAAPVQAPLAPLVVDIPLAPN